MLCILILGALNTRQKAVESNLFFVVLVTKWWQIQDLLTTQKSVTLSHQLSECERYSYLYFKMTRITQHQISTFIFLILIMRFHVIAKKTKSWPTLYCGFLSNAFKKQVNFRLLYYSKLQINLYINIRVYWNQYFADESTQMNINCDIEA